MADEKKITPSTALVVCPVCGETNEDKVHIDVPFDIELIHEFQCHCDTCRSAWDVKLVPVSFTITEDGRN